MRDESQLDAMRAAIRGDFERLAERRGEQELMRVEEGEGEENPAAEQAADRIAEPELAASPAVPGANSEQDPEHEPVSDADPAPDCDPGPPSEQPPDASVAEDEGLQQSGASSTLAEDVREPPARRSWLDRLLGR